MYQQILLTGAAGKLGGYMRGPIKDAAERVVVADREPIADLAGHETFVPCDLGDRAAVRAMTAGCDAILHFGGQPHEGTWPRVHNSNIVGCFNLWEAARVHGVKRIVFASSIHAVGMYPRSHVLRSDAYPRPDTKYGLSKMFAEGLASMYFEKYGIEAVCMRICSCTPEPENERHLTTWLSYPDLARLCLASLNASVVGFTIVFGVSNNTRSAYDNTPAAHLGYRPRDDAEVYAKKILAGGVKIQTHDPSWNRHGGPFITMMEDEFQE